MSLIPIKKPDFTLPLRNEYIDLLQEAFSSLASGLIKKREDQITKVLNDNGFYFNNRFEIEQFMKNRCKLITFTYNNRRILEVDGVPLCEWDETINIVEEDNIITVIEGI